MPTINKTQKPSFLKYFATTRYDTYMFEVIELSPQQNRFFKVKPYSDREYAFIKKARLKCDSELIKNAIYSVNNIKDLTYEQNGQTYDCMNYYITLKEKPKSVFLFDLSDKSIGI